MRRVYILLFSAVALFLAGCTAGKNEQANEKEDVSDGMIEETEDDGLADAFIAEGHQISTFILQVGDEMTTHRFISDDSNLGCRTMEEWIVKSPFDVEGWHFVGDDIVNSDETLCLTQEWVGHSPNKLSNSCVVHTRKFQRPAKVEPNRHKIYGRLETVGKDEDSRLQISGFKLMGNRHSYSDEEVETAQYPQNGVKDIQLNFFLNEHIEFYVFGEGIDRETQIVCVPHGKSFDEALFSHDFRKKGEDGLVCSDYINADLPEGIYDAYIFYHGKPVYGVNLFLSREN